MYIVILETEHGCCCGGCAGDYHGSSCGGSGFESKSSSFSPSTSTFMSKVNSSGVGGRRTFYNPVLKDFGSKPACRRLRVSSFQSAIVSILSQTFFLIQVARCSSIRTRRIYSNLCDAASSLIRISLCTCPQITANFSSLWWWASRSGLYFFFFQTLIL